MKNKTQECGVDFWGKKWAYIMLCVIFPCIPFNVVGLALIQKNTNALLEAKDDTSVSTVC